jgi:zinc D-Ala-D-Ala dipeptidase
MSQFTPNYRAAGQPADLLIHPEHKLVVPESIPEKLCGGTTFTVSIILLTSSLQLLGFQAFAANPYRQLISEARQSIVVTTNGWNSVDGTLRRFERKSGVWTQIGHTAPVVVGKNGLGWDPETRAEGFNAQVLKREGDGRSPAGVFRLTSEFGFDDSAPDEDMKYLPLTGQTECVDDAGSAFYNEIVDKALIPRPDWKSSEKMRQVAQYRLGVVVAYNARRAKGAGSCVFMHIWRGVGAGTAGCTAMDQTTLHEVIQTLDERQKPILIQLPDEIYQAVRTDWHLP